METNESGVNIMNLLAQSVAKINAMEELDGKKTELEIKMSRTAECLDVVSIVYHYLRGVSPSIASLLLDIHPDLDMDCTITLEEVVQVWKLTGDKGAVSSLSKHKDECKEKANLTELLAQFSAKINAMDDESDVKKKKFEIKMSRSAKCQDVASIVYHYLRGVSPSIASLLLDIHPEVDMDCTITLEEVVQQWKLTGVKVSSLSQYKEEAKERVKKNKDFIIKKEFENDDSKALQNFEKKKISVISDDGIKDVGVTVSKSRRKGKSVVKDIRKTHWKMFQRQFYTPREDLIILNTIKEMGENLILKDLADKLGRETGSVSFRVKKLKTGDSEKGHQPFSLAEDEAILEKVLPGLQKSKLRDLVLHDDGSLDDLAAALGRPNKGHSLALRWVYYLQPWIMQHYAGTLNLDIRMMLVNHLAETYQNRDSINWEAVAEKSEFAGNTATNLQRRFALVLSAAKSEEPSWEQILDRCREYISQARRYNSKKVQLRRSQVIQYFENYVKKMEIDDFL